MIPDGRCGRDVGEAATVGGGEGRCEDWWQRGKSIALGRAAGGWQVLVERLISPETMERTFGKVWCPIKGVVSDQRRGVQRPWREPLPGDVPPVI